MSINPCASNLPLNCLTVEGGLKKPDDQAIKKQLEQKDNTPKVFQKGMSSTTRLDELYL